MMLDVCNTEKQIQSVTNFNDLINTPFHGELNAICWPRELTGDFSEIVRKLELKSNMMVIDEEALFELQLSESGQLAREILVNDFRLLKSYGASPILNLIKCYERDDSDAFFPTDVYSYHVDRSPIPIDTFLCTYHGASSEILPNSKAEQKVNVPEIRNELKQLYQGEEEGFEVFLTEHFFDLHYQVNANEKPIRMGLGNLWKIAVDHPESKVPPCIHRAPIENLGEHRLLLIC
jgi:hypothetical protein